LGESISTKQANTHPGALQGIYRMKTTPVGKFAPNAFGLHDCHGNVQEWCDDGVAGGIARICRGGSWYKTSAFCRSASRGKSSPDARPPDIGCRLVFCPGDS
jgi:formylglycine-generating enzyme required for sulfatase activity